MTAVAIDFGTSNTVVCVLDPATKAPRTLHFNKLSRQFETPKRTVTVVPTLLVISQSGEPILGEQVRSQRLGVAQPDRYFHAFKRDLVADYQPPPRPIGDRAYTAAQVSELFLQEIWHQVRQQVQPSEVILTVPVGAFERYLDWFRDVAERLKLPKVRLVDESTAAALGYAAKRPGSIALVLDFGGGTLDLSLVRTVPAVPDQPVLKAEVLAKADAYIGGVDMDIWIVEDFLRRSGLERQNIPDGGWQTLLELAERMKLRLSREPVAKETWFDDETFFAHELHLTRPQFDEILESHQLLEQVRQAIDEVLAVAFSKGIRKSAIDLVLLVGGSCLIPAVQQLVLSYFGRERVKLHKPFEAVAHGALSLCQLADVEDYLHHSYAIRLWEPFSRTYSFYPLFEKGSRYPCQRREPITLQVATDGQREIRLDVGEIAQVMQAEVAYDAQGRMTSSYLNKQDSYRSLDPDQQQVCVAHLNPPGKAGVDRVSVQFAVNEERVLTATVRDLLTNTILVQEQSIAKLH